MYSRTRCDKMLYLTLHSDTILKKYNLPVPLKARPGVGILQQAGVDFEQVKYNLLAEAFPNALLGKRQDNEWKSENLERLFSQVSVTPCFLIQGQFSPQEFRQQALSNLGLDAATIDVIPPMADLIPDILIIRDNLPNEEEVLPNGNRQKISSEDPRKAIVVIDVKHTAEANPSYSAEVTLYAFMLVNYLHRLGLEKQYLVSAQPGLWTRSTEGVSKLMAEVKKRTADPNQLVQALTDDCDSVQFNFFIQTVRRFFKDDLPRVLAQGRTDWTHLDWHVDARCSACDWLGYRQWLDPEDAEKITTNPDHYCIPHAIRTEHLSRLVGLTRGARKTLANVGYSTVQDVAGTSGHEPVYRDHSLLRRERRHLPTRARNLNSSTTSIDPVSQLATLANNTRLRISATVNFDASAGLLTGLGLVASLSFPYRSENQPSPLRLATNAFIVDTKTNSSEWAALAAFLSQLADYIDRAEQAFHREGFEPKIQAQIAFWERRQYKELCGAIGRHLPSVFSLLERRERALAWLFPPDELMARPEDVNSPIIVFIDEIIRQFVFTPVTHTLTLANTVEHYYYGDGPPRKLDSYYLETLTNGIPKERIYEIWSGAPTIKRGRSSIARTNVIVDYDNAIKWQCRALESVIIRLHIDFKGRLITNAKEINMSLPQGTRSVAFDSKLWYWWDQLEYAITHNEDLVRMAEPPESLESSFEAIRLTTLVQVLPNGNRVYTVSPDSTEVKLQDGDSYLAVGLETVPAFPLLRAIRFGKLEDYEGFSPQRLYSPLYSILKGRLVHFDRHVMQAEIALTPTDPDLIPFLEGPCGLSFDQGIYLMDGVSNFKRYETTLKIIQQIRNPSIAQPAPGAQSALGAVSPSKPGRDPITPAACVLWDATSLQTNTYPLHDTQRAEVIKLAVDSGLNDSQQEAVLHALQNRLTVIWGPPGTGKTSTLSVLAHAVTRQTTQTGQGLNMLICGPTYKAIEEVIGRLLVLLQSDATVSCEVFIAYSRSTDPKAFSSTAPNIKVTSFQLINSSLDWENCSQSLSNQRAITIVATTCHQSHKFNELAGNILVCPLFDFVILDESSQVPVTLALGPLATLKEEFRLVIAGDHLQMPPISALEPPVGAEYLVGSIQSYLIGRFKDYVTQNKLLVNYRSADAIVQFARQIGYPTNLQANFPDTRIHLLKEIQSLQNQLPVDLPWFDSLPDLLDPQKVALTMLHNDELASQSNQFEAKIVATIVYCLRNAASDQLDGRGVITHQPPTVESFWKECIGIVTPHRAQRALIIRELSKYFPEELNEINSAVDTVEKFQGGQRHTILVSFGVGDTDIIVGEEEFLMQLERTNVAISRAMAKCIVIMPTNLAAHVPEQKKALETAHALKGFLDEFCNQSIPITVSDGQQSRTGQLKWAG